MRRALALLAAAAAAVGLARFLSSRRRGREPFPRTFEPEVDPRASELRAKLDESRPAAGEEDVESGPEPDPDARRRGVHDEGRAAVERMRGGAAADPE